MPKKRAPLPTVNPIELVASTLPDEAAELLRIASEAAASYDAAVMASNASAAEAAAHRVSAVVWKLNGGTMAGSRADDDSPGYVVAHHCAAMLGEVPRWGQMGEFLVEVAGVRAVVRFGDVFSWSRCHMEFHAVDVALPFVSETGYRSHFFGQVMGCTVDEAARSILAGLIREQGKRMVDLKYRQHCQERAQAFTWLRGSTATDSSVEAFEDDAGQFAFAF